MAAAAAGASWSCLPADLLREAFQRLSTDADWLHVRQVCAHWRAAASPLAACRPWIVAGRKPWRGAGPVGEYSFWSPHGRRRISSGAPSGVPYCCGTPRGWLALADDLRSPMRLILWEPVSKAEVFLPPLPAVGQVFLSGDPLTSLPSDWMAIACQRISQSNTEDVQRLFFWRHGEAAWYSECGWGLHRVTSTAFHGRRLYAVDRWWRLCVYDLDVFPPKRVLFSLFDPAIQPSMFGPRYGLRAVYLVSCNGDLLVALLRWGRHPTLAEVYKPDWTGLSLPELGERVTDLGEYSLFLGRGDAFALSAKEFPSIRRNCVYFVEHDELEHEHWAVVFNLESNARKQITYPEDHRKLRSNGNHWLAYSWFCPQRPFLKQ